MDSGFWVLDFLKGIMDFDVKLKVNVAFSDEGMMLVLDMKLCEKERKEEEKKKEDEEDQTKPSMKGKSKKEEEKDPNSPNKVRKKKGGVKSCS